MNFLKWIMGRESDKGAIKIVRTWVAEIYDIDCIELVLSKHQTFEKIKPKDKKKQIPKDVVLALFESAWSEYSKMQDSVRVHHLPIIHSVEKTYNCTDKTETESESRVMDVRDFIVPPANVSVKAGLTISLGDFESFRIDIGLSIPVYAEEVDRVFPMVEQWVKARVHNAAVTAKGKSNKPLWPEPKLDFNKPKDEILY